MLDYKIYTFLELCNAMNYRKTAERLNMTQPAVTNQIKQLEQEYGCKLFEYKNRVLHKTKSAVVLENYAISARTNATRLSEEISGIEHSYLRIGATKTIGEYILSEQVRNLLAQVPLRLTYTVDNTRTLLKMIKDNKLDFAFIEGFFNKDEFACHTYANEQLTGICAATHRFAGATVDIDELFSQTLILREGGSGTGEAFMRILSSHNRNAESFQNIIRCNSFKVITDFVSAGLGISFVYESVATQTEGVSKFRINGVDGRHEFACVHLKNTAKPKYIEYFLPV